MSTKITINFLGRQPRSWDEVIGNYRIKKYFRRLAKKVRKSIDGNANLVLDQMSFLLTGLSRTGKTALVKLLIRTIVCNRLDAETFAPCDGTCPACSHIAGKEGREGKSGLFVNLDTPDEKTLVHFHLIDCTKIQTPADVENKLTEISQSCAQGDYVIVYLDEVHRLVKRGMDEILLKEVEEKRYFWFFSTAKPGGLEDMFQNRLIKLTTELPTVEEMEKLLVDLCGEAGMNWEPEAIIRLIEKSNRIVGVALQALAMAFLDPDEGLTLDLVENDWSPGVDQE